jgi:hypothetical protein
MANDKNSLKGKLNMGFQVIQKKAIQFPLNLCSSGEFRVEGSVLD